MLYWIINNYQLGAKYEITPTGKVVSKERVDSRHTKVVYEGLTPAEVQLCEKAYSRKGKTLDE